MNFSEWLDNNWRKDNIFPPALEAQEGIKFLQKYLLGEDWYIVNPLSSAQANCEVVHDILYKYSRKFRREMKRKKYRKWEKYIKAMNYTK